MAQRYTFFINLACKLRNNSSNLAYGLLIDLSKRSLFYNKSVKFSSIFLPVSAKSCIFAASIGIKNLPIEVNYGVYIS